MVVNNLLENIFNKTSNVRVLRTLVDRVVGISGRETARLSGLNLRSAQIALENLENLKLVNRLVSGRDHIFTLNRENFIVQNIVNPLFQSEQLFKEKLYSIIKNSLGKFSDSLILYGSVVRKEDTIGSDFDLCIVYSKDKAKIESLLDELRIELNNKFGITLAPFIITKSEFRKRAKLNRIPVTEIIKEGKVLYGISLNKLQNG